MTDRLEEIRARLDAATPGPWVRNEHPQSGAWMFAVWCRADDPMYSGETIGSGFRDEDADLIAHAPADIAWLLAEVSRARKMASLWKLCAVAYRESARDLSWEIVRNPEHQRQHELAIEHVVAGTETLFDVALLGGREYVDRMRPEWKRDAYNRKRREKRAQQSGKAAQQQSDDEPVSQDVTKLERP